MKDFNKDKFNDSVKQKFDEAKFQPSHNVWEGIEAELLKQDNKMMQKKAAFYRNIAAAVLLVALVSIYFNVQDFTSSTAEISTLAPMEIEEQNSQLFLSENDVIMAAPKSTKRQGVKEKETSGVNSIFSSASREENRVEERGTTQSRTNTVPSSDQQDVNFLARMEAKRPEKSVLPLLEVEVKEVSYFAVSSLDKPTEKSQMAWNTNVNVGSGSFNPNSEITSSPVNSTVSTLNNPGTSARMTTGPADYNSQEREAVQDLSSAPMRSDISFTVGLHAGLSLSERLNIKSGLQFGNYRSSSNSSTVIRDRNSDMFFPYHGASSSTEISDGRVINVTSEYDFYNDFQILSIPVMASYKILDRKLDIAVVAGATADFILKNTLRGGSDQINDVTFKQNDRQSYKNIFASGIAGIEISYPFADRYALSFMPTYKRALSNVTTEEATFNSMPAFMGVNMSLAYMF